MSQARIKKPPVRKQETPVEASNRQILEDRQKRIDAARVELPDLGLKIPEAAAEPANATEFMDEFDKHAFGYGNEATITKIIYGPDPLVDHSPSFREVLERHGRDDLAELYRRAILAKGAAAMTDPLFRKALASSIAKFGAERTAEAFAQRVLQIPMRTVEIDASDELDPEILGSAVLSEAVRRYERPGMAYRFFTQQCLDRFGWRGYTPVKQNGDIVKAGTLMLGEIGLEQANRRRLRQATMAREKLEGIADGYAAAQEETLRTAADEGIHTAGVSPLSAGEMVTARAGVGGNDPEEYLGQQRGAGIEITRES